MFLRTNSLHFSQLRNLASETSSQMRSKLGKFLNMIRSLVPST
jgi:hypothetical protein